jgi:hypothetical protein
MAFPAANHPDDAAGAPLRRRAPDLLNLAAGLVALGIAGTTLFGGLAWLPGVDLRWTLAAVAMGVGLVLVIGSVRPPRR